MAGRPSCGFANIGFGRPPQAPPRHKTLDSEGAHCRGVHTWIDARTCRQTEKPVVDKTGITGKFDFKVEYAFTPQEIKQLIQGRLHADPWTGRSESDFDTGPTFHEALEDQLGLKLVETKGPWPYFVIEHVERPSPN